MAADEQEAGTGVAASPALTLAAYAAAIFLSAALLFAVQPLFTKMVLPRLGGSPSVWSVAMVFFQIVLLAGYSYAHALTRFLPRRAAVIVHVAVLVVASLALPLSIASGWGRQPDHGEAFWLMGLFAVSIGLPFFALSANGPLLQSWFAHSGHPSAREPYFLYAVSNVGSLLALLSYPFVFEPLTTLGLQRSLWSIGFYVLIVLVALCGLLMLRSRPADAPAADVETDAGTPVTAPPVTAPSWRDAATWMALAAVPAGLLIAVTAHLSTDVAAAPLLWVIPLALYLLTFVIVFQPRPVLPHRWMVMVEPLFIMGLVVLLTVEVTSYIFLTIAANTAAFFVIALVCHGELARRRPAARYLTSFYMWMSAGGMVGGIAAGLIAPLVFPWVAEYPLLIVLAILCRPGLAWPATRGLRIGWLVLLAAAVTITLLNVGYQYGLEDKPFKAAIAALLLVSILFWKEPLKFAAVIALAFMVARLHDPGVGKREFVRSFFGVYKIEDSSDGAFRIFMHGTTEHGAQRLREDNGQPVAGLPEPLTYYHRTSPLAEATAAVRTRKGAPIRIAVVGLGTGTFACLTVPGDTLDFYEIDRLVVRIATDPARFTYISKCKPEARIIVGDARLTLAEAADGAYDVIVMDAFSSDAIPIHLLTKEAMAIYLKKLAPGGLVLMHISNRHLELGSVVAGIAAANGGVSRLDDSDKDESDNAYKFSSTVVAIARTQADFGTLAGSADWQVQEPDPKQRTWSDDYSNIIGAMIRHLQ